ncbi:ATP-binding protein [Terasakiella sp. A23]|uniref:sensor histidine kinase n=1 Tax=Terasakiella sp. FCG-A23 TaxID=3080561 RepID=UPI002952C257|nr:ATP-binding protein [Terasakiella sp. A23]MDV7338339.1 ATP-binding protein [Terasakiella sp. A23]
MAKLQKRMLGLLLAPLLAICLIGFLIMEIAKEHDEHMEEERSRFIQAVLKNQTNDVALVAHVFTLWSEAVNEIILKKNPDFIDANIGAYMLETYDYQASLVLNPENEKFLRVDVPKTDPGFIPFELAGNTQLHHLADQARSHSPKDFKALGHWAKINGELFLVGASAFTYNESHTEQKTTRSREEQFVLLTFIRANQAYWDHLTNQYALPNVHFEDDVEHGLELPIYNSQNQKVSHLVAHGHTHVIQSIFESFGPIVIVITLILIGFAIFAIKRSLDYKEALGKVTELNEHMDELVKSRTDELTIALEHAEEASRAKTVFLSSMSHEFRTPLNGILGFNQLMGLNKNGTLTEKEKEWTRQIQTAGELLLSLVNDVLDMAHVESGKITLDTETLQARDIFKQCYQITKPMADKKNITLEGHPESDKYIKVDPRRLQQVILNLLNNAIKYSGEDSQVTFGCKNRGTDHVRLYVTDTGPGISENERQRIFEPFYRGQHNMHATEGTGVGLALVVRLVEAMGGTVSLESEVGRGSTFYLDFPAHDNLE